MPGMYALGGWYDGNEFVDLGTGAPSRGNYGLYLMGQQMVLRHGDPGSPRGLTVFAMLTWAPRVDVNVVPRVETGASWHGFASARPLDTVALALWWGRASPALPDLRGTGIRGELRPRLHPGALARRRPAGDPRRERSARVERARRRLQLALTL